MKKLNAFIISLILIFPVLAMGEPHAFPVPWVATQDGNVIHFTELPGEGSIKIFTVVGEEVIHLRFGPGDLSLEWNITNSSGEKVSTGVYLFLITGPSHQTKGKLIVIR